MKSTSSDPIREGQLVLGERISRGKEGSIYAIEGEPNLVAKVFKRGKVTTHRKEKVELMVQHKVWLPGICFPESRLILRWRIRWVHDAPRSGRTCAQRHHLHTARA